MKRKLIALFIACIMAVSVVSITACNGGHEDAGFTLTFNMHGGPEREAITHSEAGATITRPPNPTREGYVFTDWFMDEAFTTSVTWPITLNESMTIHARWAQATTLTFELHGGSGTGFANRTGANNRPAEQRPATNPTRTGYVFTDWFTQATGGTVVTWPITMNTNTTVHAQWRTAQNFTVTLNLPGGYGELPTGIVSPMSVVEGTNVSLPNPTRQYWDFAGWFTAPTGGDRIASIANVSGNHTLYAQWAVPPAPGEGWHIRGMFNAPGFTMNSAMPGRVLVVPGDGDDFIFTVTLREGFALADGPPVVHFLMAREQQEPIVGVADSDNPGVYTFTIENITGHIFIEEVTGIVLPAGAMAVVRGIEHHINYTMTGTAVILRGETANYTFTVVPRFGFGGEPVATISINEGEEEELTGTLAGGVWTFTIPVATIAAAAGAEGHIFVDILSIEGINENLVTSRDMTEDGFFNTENWIANTRNPSIGAPAPHEDGGLSFINSNHGFYIGTYTEEIHLSFETFLPSGTNNIQFTFFSTPESTQII